MAYSESRFQDACTQSRAELEAMSEDAFLEYLHKSGPVEEATTRAEMVELIMKKLSPHLPAYECDLRLGCKGLGLYPLKDIHVEQGMYVCHLCLRAWATRHFDDGTGRALCGAKHDRLQLTDVSWRADCEDCRGSHGSRIEEFKAEQRLERREAKKAAAKFLAETVEKQKVSGEKKSRLQRGLELQQMPTAELNKFFKRLAGGRQTKTIHRQDRIEIILNTETKAGLLHDYEFLCRGCGMEVLNTRIEGTEACLHRPMFEALGQHNLCPCCAIKMFESPASKDLISVALDKALGLGVLLPKKK